MVHLAPRCVLLVRELGACRCGLNEVVELEAAGETTWMDLESEEMMVE